MAKASIKGIQSAQDLVRVAGLVAIALGVFGIVVGALLLYGSMQGQLATEQASRAASDRARHVADGLAEIQATLRDPQVLDLAREALNADDGRSERLDQAVRARGVQNLIDLRVFPSAVEEIPLGEYPEPDFSVIEMLIEARRSGRATVQVHYAGTSNENLAFAQAIEQGNPASGIMFMRVPVSMATSRLQAAAELDSIALIQGSGDQAAVLKAIGQAPEQVQLTPVEGSRLSLRWSRRTIVGPLSNRAAIILGASGIILLMSGLLVRRRFGALQVKVGSGQKGAKARPEGDGSSSAQDGVKRDAVPPPRSAPPPLSSPPLRATSALDTADEDLPDWLLDSDQLDQTEKLFGEEEPPPAELPDLPDTLAVEADAEPSAEPGLRFDDQIEEEGPAESDFFEQVEEHSPEEDYDLSMGGEPEDSATPELDSATPANSGLDFEFSDRGSSDAQEEVAPEPLPETEASGLQDEVEEGIEEEIEAELTGDEDGESAAAPEREALAPAGADQAEPVVDPGLFHPNGILGVVDEQLDARSATLIGEAIGAEARARGLERIVVGRDGRMQGVVLLSALSQGLCSAGIDVIDLGPVPIPVLDFGASELSDGSGVMVTGSHHASDINGFRIRLNNEILQGPAIQDLFRRIQEQDLSQGQGEIIEESLVDRYIERIGIDIQLERPLKVVVDCGNGISGTVVPEAFAAIGADVIPLYADVDGSFPNHPPNPSDPDNLEDLRLCVRNFQADVGLAFDGDGDCLAMVSSDGEVVRTDQLLMLLARDVLDKNAGTSVIVDAACSNKLQKLIRDAGGHVVMARCDEVFVDEKMRQESALLGGAFRGQIMLADRWYGFGDAIYAGARLLELLAADTRTVAEILAELPEVHATPEIRLSLEGDQAEELVTALIAEGDFGDGEMLTTDGLRVDYADGWGLVRASHDGPDLVLRFEGDDAKALNHIRSEFKKQIKARNPAIQLLF
ncbi:phosphomannomutase/phosphoglucomutase [Wenzhouxiangella marina]|uniref:phosphomannomutase n=1 Tax=Wenzhouxiangella marina TaxID=1579979 RepID=A0A0K0XS76_9GAMM|nr:phosphomannomutase/phosphoglucomutase [Wenzhouxiangella marina]AKS40510.1 Phosphomannomutase [Wenzhouxiangella marina]MBB6088168.1 phosphomannomutase/phosphoglucomutase [Wenzhouxiangella marina]